MLIWQRSTYDFRRGFAGWPKRKLQIHRYKKQLYGLFWKSENTCRKWGTKKCRFITLTCINPATIRPATGYFELSKCSTLKRGMDASSFLSFFCVFSIFLVFVGGRSGQWRPFKTSNSVLSLSIFYPSTCRVHKLPSKLWPSPMLLFWIWFISAPVYF